MSISGSQYKSTQNISNTNKSQVQYDNLNIRVTQNEIDIAENTTDITSNSALISTNTSAIAVHELRLDSQDAVIVGLNSRMSIAETDIQTHETRLNDNDVAMDSLDSNVDLNTSNIASILQRITDIQYYPSNDSTFINNRVTIRSTIDSATSATPQITLWNTSTQAPNQVIYSIMAGVENSAWSSLSRESDCLMLTRNQTGIPGSYTGGMIFCTHGGSSGFRFSYDPATPSEFRSDINLTTHDLMTTGSISAGDISSGSMTLSGVDLNTRLTSIENDVNSNSYALTPITYTSIPGVPGVPTLEIYTISALNVNINGDVLINSRDVLGELDTNTADISALSTTVAGISFSPLTSNLDASGYDITTVGHMDALSVTANTLITNTLEVPNLAGDYNSFITTTAVGRTQIDVSGNNTGVDLISRDASGIARTMRVDYDAVDFGGRQLTNYTRFPSMRSFSVKVTYNGTGFDLSWNTMFNDFLVSYVATGTPIVTIGQGNFKIYLSDAFTGGETPAIDDLCVTSNGIFRNNGDANSSIIIGAPQKFPITGVGCECEFYFSRADNPQSASWLIQDEGYINILFSIPTMI